MLKQGIASVNIIGKIEEKNIEFEKGTIIYTPDAKPISFFPDSSL